MSRDFCPSCEEYAEVRLGVEKEVYGVRGEPIEIEAEVCTCRKCGSKIFDEERDSRNLEKAYSRYREKHGLLSPQEIRELREKYGLSQRALSRLLGWGEITLHRYESGAIQDGAHDALLRLIADPGNMQRIFESNRSKLSSYAARRLERSIADLVQEDAERSSQVYFDRFLLHRHVDLTSGFRNHDLEKLENMILYLAQRLDGVLKTKLNKLLWYCDFLSFKETSVSIAGTRYACFRYGPVPEKYDLVIANMMSKGLIEKNEITFDRSRGVVGEEISSLTESRDDIFSEKEIEVMNYVADKFRDYTAKRIADRSHEETAYSKCEEWGETISYEYAKDLSLSLPG